MNWTETISQIINGTKDLDAGLRDIIIASLKRTQRNYNSQPMNYWAPTFLEHDEDNTHYQDGRYPANHCEIKKFKQDDKVIEVRYDHNNYGFRSEKMLPKTDNDLIVVTTGDSITYGQGLDVEYRYSDIFCKKLQQNTKKVVKNYNIAMPGHSNDYISRSIYQGIHTFQPDIIIFLFTFRNRLEWVNEKNELQQILPGFDDPTIFKLINEDWSMYNFFKNFVLIDTLCRLYNLKFCFGSLDPLIAEGMHLHTNYIGNIELDNLAHDNEHPGIEKHKEIANKTYNKYIELYDKET